MRFFLVWGVGLVLSWGVTVSSAEISTSDLKKIIILGDSLTEGYGIAKSEAYPEVLQKLIEEKFPRSYQVVGAGVSGSTTASGLGRLKWLVKAKPYVVVLALGSNDALRGIPVEVVVKNMEQMIKFLQGENIKCLLVGFRAPPNYGESYTREFYGLWKGLEEKYKIPRVSFLLEGVAGEKSMNLEDGIHPNPEGHKIIAKNIFKIIVEML